MTAATSLAGSVPLLKTLTVTVVQLEDIRAALIARRDNYEQITRATTGDSFTRGFNNVRIERIDALLILVAKA